ncbi:Nn.00g068270.m01.CDS01 [Neocucurbitaria sp. VM-36]
MLLRTPCISRTVRTQIRRVGWRRIPFRRYSSTGTDDPPWFQQVRAEMLQRDVSWLLEDITTQPEHKLIRTLSGFLPDEWCRLPTFKSPVLPVGHHLIWFNLAAPSHELLPDGTDNFHSPPDPWVRRMWAGGSVQLKPDEYMNKKSGFILGASIAGAERIKDVRLRGKDDAAKIFVTIERRFARLDRLYESHRRVHEGSKASNAPNVHRHFKQQLRDDEEWGDAILKEERNLVFFKERTVAEIDAIKAGQMAPIRYLDPPGKPDFSHTLTPTRALLFRYSALTFNAHLIHLDRDYARNVEGHRNLLVHGPLSLTLVLQAVAGYVNTHTQARQVIESIEYRNLAPLYCDEQMSICGVEKKKSGDGSTFEVWIEGPTGGVAVKGTVRTVVRAPAQQPPSAPSEFSQKTKHGEPRRRTKKQGSSKKVQATDTVGDIAPLVLSTASAQQPPGKALTLGRVPKSKSVKPSTKHELPTPSPQLQTPRNTTPVNTSSQLPLEKRDDTTGQLSGKVDRRLGSTRSRYHQLNHMPSSSSAFRRVNTTPKPTRPTMSPRSRSIIRRGRLLRQQSSTTAIKPIPLLRKYDATPYKYDATQIVARHSRFRREGVRKIEKLRVRMEGQKLDEVRRKVRGRFMRS